MARTFIKDSATTQFFICVAPCDYLDGEYAAFGKILDEESYSFVDEDKFIGEENRESFNLAKSINSNRFTNMEEYNPVGDSVPLTKPFELIDQSKLKKND